MQRIFGLVERALELDGLVLATNDHVPNVDHRSFTPPSPAGPASPYDCPRLVPVAVIATRAPPRPPERLLLHAQAGDLVDVAAAPVGQPSARAGPARLVDEELRSAVRPAVDVRLADPMMAVVGERY